MSHDFLSIYEAKTFEYLLAIGYLLLFIPFWRYVQGGKRRPAEAHAAAGAHAAARVATAAAAHAGATALRPSGWFHVPAGVSLHPGHTWARLEKDGLVTVGIDEFAQKLVGPSAVSLPALGAKVAQGEVAIGLEAEGGSAPMLSPVDGTVVAVNPAVKGSAAALADSYGAGWLYKVKAPRLAANLRQLHASGPANRMLEDAAAALVGKMSPELGQVLQDGGTPVNGIAREVAGAEWVKLAKEFFRT